MLIPLMLKNMFGPYAAPGAIKTDILKNAIASGTYDVSSIERIYLKKPISKNTKNTSEQ